MQKLGLADIPVRVLATCLSFLPMKSWFGGAMGVCKQWRALRSDCGALCWPTVVEVTVTTPVETVESSRLQHVVAFLVKHEQWRPKHVIVRGFWLGWNQDQYLGEIIRLVAPYVERLDLPDHVSLGDRELFFLARNRCTRLKWLNAPLAALSASVVPVLVRSLGLDRGRLDVGCIDSGLGWWPIDNKYFDGLQRLSVHRHSIFLLGDLVSAEVGGCLAELRVAGEVTVASNAMMRIREIVEASPLLDKLSWTMSCEHLLPAAASGDHLRHLLATRVSPSSSKSVQQEIDLRITIHLDKLAQFNTHPDKTRCLARLFGSRRLSCLCLRGSSVHNCQELDQRNGASLAVVVAICELFSATRPHGCHAEFHLDVTLCLDMAESMQQEEAMRLARIEQLQREQRFCPIVLHVQRPVCLCCLVD